MLKVLRPELEQSILLCVRVKTEVHLTPETLSGSPLLAVRKYGKLLAVQEDEHEDRTPSPRC